MTESTKNEAVVETSGIKMPGKAIFICALIFSLWPLVVGVSVFLLWWLTRWQILEMLGAFTIYGGIISVLLAFVAVVGYIIVAVKARVLLKKVALNAVIVLIAIIINFPAAFACIVGVDYISSIYALTIENRSSATIQQLTISGRDTIWSIGPILPGGKDHVKFRITFEGSLTFSASSNGNKIDGVLEGYVTSGCGGQRTLEIEDGGKYLIDGKPPVID
jgi:hypothetical protein